METEQMCFQAQGSRIENSLECQAPLCSSGPTASPEFFNTIELYISFSEGNTLKFYMYSFFYLLRKLHIYS